MTFSLEQTELLKAPLNRDHVATREQAGQRLSYVEAWHVIAEANRIFGFDGWTRETVLLQETNRDLVELKGKNGPYTQWRVGYLAKVRVTVGGVVREGSGFGSGMSKPEALGDAIESAVKEAESDAMKRALMTFGNPFGLALYDKSQANVAEALSAAADFAIATMRTCRNLEELVEFWTKNAKGLRSDLRPFEFEAVEKAKDEEKARLSSTPFDREAA